MRDDIEEENQRGADLETDIKALVDQITDGRFQMRILAQAILPVVPEKPQEMFEEAEQHVRRVVDDVASVKSAAATQGQVIARETEELERLREAMQELEARCRAIITRL